MINTYRLGEDLDYGTYEITITACGATKPLPDQTFAGLITDTILYCPFMGLWKSMSINFDPKVTLASRSCPVEGFLRDW